MKRTILFSLIFFLSATIFAQEKISVVFNEMTHDFGVIHEEDGKATTVFTFVNNSAMPITIKSVKASCGCTTPSYSREVIAPHGEGKITVAYNAQGRPGKFTKNVTVQLGTDIDTKTESLTITGEVTPKMRSITESFAYKAGDLLLREQIVNFGSVFKSAAMEKITEVYNNSDREMVVTFGEVPDYIKVTFDGEPKLAPKTKTAVRFSLNTEKMKLWGDISQNISIKINGKTTENYTIKAKINEDFSKLTAEQLKNAPIAVADKKNLNLLTIKLGEKRSSKIKLTNAGKTPLLIRSVRSDIDYLIVKPSKEAVASGKSIDLNIMVDASKIPDEFPFRKQVQVITNDPVNPVLTLVIEWQTKK
ncbi:MAG: DUF1573 domain-containing protein [Prevotellaceae bacterium]|jgi:hypothetical protein|nr:DUF1573 domain-containing protein [Prevotellaceae bacterium]